MLTEKEQCLELLSDYKTVLEKILEEYKGINKDEKPYLTNRIRIFSKLYNDTYNTDEEDENIKTHLSLFNEKYYLENQTYHNDLNSVLKYINKQCSQYLDESYKKYQVNVFKGKEYSSFCITIKKSKTADPIKYLEDTMNYIMDRSKDIKKLTIFYNLQDNKCDTYFDSILKEINKNKISLTLMSNFIYHDFDQEMGDYGNDSMLILSEIEQAFIHFYAIFELDKKKWTHHKYMIKYDVNSNINIRIADINKSHFHTIMYKFMKHHLSRVDKVKQNRFERHTLILDSSNRKTNPDYKTLAKYIDTFAQYKPLESYITEDARQKHLNEIKEIRDQTLYYLNLFYVRSKTESSLLKTIVWLIYSIKRIRIIHNEEMDENLKQVFITQHSDDIVWNTIRELKGYFKADLDVPNITRANIRDILRKIHIPDDGSSALSTEFPEISFPSDRRVLSTSLERIVREDKLRNRLANFFGKNTLTKEEASEKIRITYFEEPKIRYN